MPRYRLTREFTTTGMIEVNASSPERAVQIAHGRPLSAWRLDGDYGAAHIDAVSEAKQDGRCWGVSMEHDCGDDECTLPICVGRVTLDEVE